MSDSAEWCGDSEWGVHSGSPCEFCGQTATLTPTDFLLARIAEDEADVRASTTPEQQYGTPWHWRSRSRVLAECEAKRRIVEECKAWSDEWAAENLGGHVLRHLAAIYADHPDHREEWRV